MDRAIEEGPPGLTREQHMENMRREAEESRLENKRLRDQYDLHLREVKAWKPKISEKELAGGADS